MVFKEAQTLRAPGRDYRGDQEEVGVAIRMKSELIN